MNKSNSPITPIPSISYHMGALNLDGIGFFERFDNADKILIYAGLSPSTYLSSQLDSSHPRRKTIPDTCDKLFFYTTRFVCKWDESFGIYLGRKITEGKLYNVTVSYDTKKLIRTIYRMKHIREAYSPRLLIPSHPFCLSTQ